MKKLPQKNKTSNVSSIAENPRFKATGKSIYLPSTVDPNGKFDLFVMQKNLFGFAGGDELICRTDFDADGISPNALVISDTANGQKLKTAAAAENILAVVVAFTREVQQ